MERITNDVLNERVRNVNRRIADSGRKVAVLGRNGAVGLDEYRVEYDVTRVPDKRYICVRTITVGTKREIADFLHAMMVGIDLSRAD